MPEPADTIILIPTYNEAENISLILDQIFSVSQEFSVLVLDDNSPDGTAAIVERQRARYPNLRVVKRLSDRGFGKSYLDGFRRAFVERTKDIIVTMDADFSHEPKEIPFLLRLLASGADVATGSRHARGGRFPGIPLWRRVLSRFANSYVRLVLGFPIADCTSGFIAMKTSALAAIHPETLRSEGYGFLFEMKYRFHQQGFLIKEHPVAWPNRHKGVSKMSRKIMWESFLLPWRIRFSTQQSETAGAAR